MPTARRRRATASRVSARSPVLVELASFAGAILRAVGTSRDELVAEVMVALTDTLRDDFDVADMLYTLTTACVDLLDVDAAGMLLIDEEGQLVPVAATHDGSENLGKLQVMVREGPCLEAVRTIEPVHSADLDDDAGRWPEFARQARAEGFRAVHAEPVVLRVEVVGALGLFRSQPGPVPAVDQRLAQFLTRATAIGLLHRRAQANVETVNEQLKHALTSRIVIEQAKGFLAERHTLDVDSAFGRLRSHARRNGQPLTKVARAIIEGSLDIT
jgi:GAF domain-containing protein